MQRDIFFVSDCEQPMCLGPFIYSITELFDPAEALDLCIKNGAEIKEAIFRNSDNLQLYQRLVTAGTVTKVKFIDIDILDKNEECPVSQIEELIFENCINENIPNFAGVGVTLLFHYFCKMYVFIFV